MDTSNVEQLINTPFHLSVAVTKVDKEKRLVTGIATCEAVDKAGEVVDYDTAKKFFQSPELWPGNIREMHQPKAVGKAVDVEFDDANKVISLTSRISKGAPETWEKVLDGTLSMYSIGGSGDRVVEKTATGGTVKRIFLKNLAEVSLVDNGANPMAKFDIVKADGAGTLVDAQPAEEPGTGEAEAKPEPDAVAKGSYAGTGTETGPDSTAPAAQAGTSSPAEGEPSQSPAATSLRARGAVLAVLTKFVNSDAGARSPKTAEAIAKFAGRIETLTTPEDIAKGCPEPWDIDRALSAISLLENLLATEYWDAKYGAMPGQEPDATKVAQVQMLRYAIEWIFQFLLSEHLEQFSDLTSAGDAAAKMTVIIPDADAAVKMADLAFNVVKAGARNSKSDLERIQKMHDNSVELGAMCKTVEKVDTPPTPEPEPVAKVDTPVQTVVATDDVEKMNRELSEQRQTIKEQGDTITALKERVDEILKMARPGGPQVRAVAVEKSLGGEAPAASDTLTPSGVIGALRQVASESSDPVVKQALATEMLKIQQRTGEGRIDFSLNK